MSHSFINGDEAVIIGSVLLMVIIVALVVKTISKRK
jgi:hypothetical protein